MVGWLRAFLFLVGGVVAATGTAYFTGLLDPYLGREPAAVATLPSQIQPTAKEEQSAAETEPEPQDEAAPAAPTETVDSASKQDRLVSPSFDLLRVEPNGSIVIAGKAAPDSQVEVMHGDKVIATTKAGREGDFVAVFDEALAPGDYQLSLRATSGEGAVMSVETAIVSVPQDSSGQVLAMVEAPGQAAELISVPEAAEPEVAETAADQSQTEAAQGETAPAEEAAPAEADQATMAQSEPSADATGEEVPSASADADDAAESEKQIAAEEPAAADAQTSSEEEVAAANPAAEEATAPQAAVSHTVSVDAVEIEGDTIFVAGQATAGLTVRVYAGDILLGDARVSDGGRFLVEAKRDLPVGSYVIRADVLGQDGNVVARAAVPFEREPGEAIAAVAPQQPAAAAETPAAPQEPAANDAQEGETAGETAVATLEKEQVKADDLTAPALQRADGAVIIRRGDSLWRISRRVYGRGVRYSTIYLANQDQIADPNRIWPGQVFAVPSETSEGEQADMNAIGDQVVTPDEAPDQNR